MVGSRIFLAYFYRAYWAQVISHLCKCSAVEWKGDLENSFQHEACHLLIDKTICFLHHTYPTTFLAHWKFQLPRSLLSLFLLRSAFSCPLQTGRSFLSLLMISNNCSRQASQSVVSLRSHDLYQSSQYTLASRIFLPGRVSEPDVAAISMAITTSSQIFARVRIALILEIAIRNHRCRIPGMDTSSARRTNLLPDFMLV